MTGKRLGKMSANELIRLFSELERLKQGEEDTFAMVVDGKAYCANTHRKESPFVLGGEEVTAERFFYLQELARIELACRFGISIQARPPHRRKPKPDAISDEEK